MHIQYTVVMTTRRPDGWGGPWDRAGEKTPSQRRSKKRERDPTQHNKIREWRRGIYCATDGPSTLFFLLLPIPHNGTALYPLGEKGGRRGKWRTSVVAPAKAEEYMLMMIVWLYGGCDGDIWRLLSFAGYCLLHPPTTSHDHVRVRRWVRPIPGYPIHSISLSQWTIEVAVDRIPVRVLQDRMEGRGGICSSVPYLSHKPDEKRMETRWEIEVGGKARRGSLEKYANSPMRCRGAFGEEEGEAWGGGEEECV